MKIKTSELIGMSLDWAVALANNMPVYPPEIFAELYLIGRGNYSTDWAKGGPIIDQLKGTMWSINASWWGYRAPYKYANDKEGPTTEGPTLLIAAMRCYVASKLGEKVDIPDELVAATRSAA